MKKTFLSRCAAMATATLLSFSAFSQAPLPPNFQSQKQAEYNALSNPEITFSKYYNSKVNSYQRKQALLLGAAIPYVPGSVIHTPCGNGNFEPSFNSSEWQGGSGEVDTSGTILFADFEDGIFPGPYNSMTAHQTPMTPGPDSVLLASLPSVTMNRVDSGSTVSMRIGNAEDGYGSELISKTFVVTPANATTNFRYAVVLQNPQDASHTLAKQPTFLVRVLDHSNGNVEVPGVVNLDNGSNQVIANAANPFFQQTTYRPPGEQTAEPLVYRRWTCAQIDLSSVVGHTVTVQFIVKDCAWGGHFGYAYVDNFCGVCGSDNPTGSIIDAGPASLCCQGQICCSFTVPRTPSGITGFVKPMLDIYQNGVLLQTIAGPTFGIDSTYCFNINPASIPGLTASGFDYVLRGLFNMSTGPLPTLVDGSSAIGQGGGVNDDYRVECPSNQCCPGTNYIKNGTFSSLINTFTSDYTYQAPGAGSGSVGSGEYSVMTSAEASAISPTWIPGCPDYGRALIVNGATEMSTGPKMVWTQTSGTLTPGAYRFCVDLRNLPQCDFNAPSRVTVSFSGNGPGPIPFYGSSVITVGGNGCNWTTLIRNLNIPSGVTSLQVSISLTETVIGDGNDLAIDNINLTRLDTVSVAQAHFTHTTSNVNSSTYNITANATAALNAGCTRFWQVEEVTNTSTPNVYNVVPGTQVINPVAWQNINPNTFIGYNGTSTLSGSAPGVFQVGKLYRIFYSSDCPCMTRRMTFHIVTVVLRPGFPPTPIPVDSGVVDDPGDGGGQGRMAPGAGGNGISVFPNPTDNKVTVQMEPLQADAILKVLSLSGQELKSISVPANDTQVDLSLQELPAGMYLLQMTSRTGEKLLNYKISKL